MSVRYKRSESRAGQRVGQRRIKRTAGSHRADQPSALPDGTDFIEAAGFLAGKKSHLDANDFNNIIVTQFDGLRAE